MVRGNVQPWPGLAAVLPCPTCAIPPVPPACPTCPMPPVPFHLFHLSVPPVHGTAESAPGLTAPPWGTGVRGWAGQTLTDPGGGGALWGDPMACAQQRPDPNSPQCLRVRSTAPPPACGQGPPASPGLILLGGSAAPGTPSTLPLGSPALGVTNGWWGAWGSGWRAGTGQGWEGGAGEGQGEDGGAGKGRMQG